MKPLYVVVSGLDGSGKTTVIEALRKRLEAEGLATIYMWMRYNHVLVKPVHGLCRLVGLSRRQQTKKGDVWRHEFYRCQMFCSFYIFLTWLDTWLGRFRLAWRLRSRQVDVVLCDRWINDILVDLAVDSRRENLLDSQWLKRFERILPRPVKQYLIMRKTTDVLECRRENEEDPAFPVRQRMYDLLQHKAKNLSVVDNNGIVTKAVCNIADDVLLNGPNKE